MINEKTEYRSGPKLVQFFNDLGFNDSYGQGFPSRWVFTDECLTRINGTPALDQCIKNTFAPVNFIGRTQELDILINKFNQYLAFDKWKVVRVEADISFQKLDKVEIKSEEPKDSENEFLSREFTNVGLKALKLENAISDVLQYRIKEIEKCFSSGSPLAVILLAGSALEGIFLGLAIQYPKKFNTAHSSPKDNNSKVRPFHEWSLSCSFSARCSRQSRVEWRVVCCSWLNEGGRNCSAESRMAVQPFWRLNSGRCRHTPILAIASG